jgi:hypothetical protein
MKPTFKNSNTITISGWMVNELKLSGNDLILYAMIYGFSQDGESEYYGSLNYICSAINCSKPTAIKTLNSLIDKCLIFKTQNSINGISFSKYRVNIDFFNGSKETLPLVKNLNDTSKETLLVGSKETLPNNYNNNIYNNIYNNIDKEKLIFFKDCFWNSYENLKAELSKDEVFKKDFAGVDLKFYINEADTWSESKRVKRTERGWYLTLRKFMREAKQIGKLQINESFKKIKGGHTNH